MAVTGALPRCLAVERDQRQLMEGRPYSGALVRLARAPGASFSSTNNPLGGPAMVRSRALASIDDERVAGDEVGGRRRKKDNGALEVLGASESPERDG